MAEFDSKITWPGWQTVRLIGRGSFGAVYEIERDVLGEKERAALKVITIPQSSSDIDELYGEGYDEESITSTFKEHLKSIVAEYSLMRRLNGSANVVNCDDVRYVQHDSGIGWDIFIKMELLTPLIKVLGRDIPDEQVVRVGSDMCRALMLCKKHSIIHRDIKPANIFVSENGDYKLGDFGIAKTVEKTSGGTRIGTYDYMAPEVYHDRPYGSTVDIYSLGMVLYWLLNERRTPFLKLPPELPTNTEKEQARKRRFAGEPIPAPAHGGAELIGIVLKACAYDPQERYQSAEEMLRDLEALAPKTAETPSVPAEYADEDVTVGTQPGFSAPAPKAPPADVGEETLGTVGAWNVRAPGAAPEQDRPRSVQPLRCRKCGAELRPGMKFCTSCGTPQSDTAPSVPTAPARPAAQKTPQPAAPKKKDGRKSLIAAIVIAALLITGAVIAVVVSLSGNSRSSDSVSTRAASGLSTPRSTPKPVPTTEPTPEPTPEHVHRWTEATCTEPQICADCGEVGSPALGHDWIDATYDSPMTCRRCGVTSGDPKGYIGTLYGTWADKPMTINYNRFYPFLLNSPVENCFELTLEMTVTKYTGAPAGYWYLYGRDLNGKWTKIGDFTITKEQLDNGTIIVPFRFDPTVSFDALTAFRKGTNGYNITYYLDFYDCRHYVG